MKELLRIGSRGSKLALWQTNFVAGLLKARNPGMRVEISVIATTGDKNIEHPLTMIDDKGLFTKEIEKAILSGDADAAVHSLKDLPTDIAGGLCLAAIMEREDPSDALVARDATSLADMPMGSRVGTGSPRRMAQLLALRPDLICKGIRGNLDTRMRKLNESGEYDAIIVARAGLARLGGLDRITEAFSGDRMLPAPGQGALAVECREDDVYTREIIAALDHADTALVTRAERAFLRVLEGGCRVPIGALGRVRGNELVLQGVVAAADGRRLLRGEHRGPKNKRHVARRSQISPPGNSSCLAAAAAPAR